MAIARAQARSLLTDAEMALFGDSRNPALRSLTERELARRIDRARKLRDKSRDLLQRQRLSSRERTGNKGGKTGAANERTARKGEVLDDVLQRFENRLHELERTGTSGVGRKSSTAAARKGRAADDTAKAKKKPRPGGAAKKTAGAATKSTRSAKKTAATVKSTAVSRTSGAAKRAIGNESQKARTGTSTTAKTTPKKSTRAASGRPRKSAVTPEQALASTRELLEAKRERQNGPRPYPGDGDAGQPAPGYQSGQARAKALELHAGEIRMEPIHGSISTRDRKNQAKRDRT